MVSKTLKRQRKNKRNRDTASAALLSKIEASVGKTATAKVRITHKMKSKRKYRIGGASPGDVYEQFEKFVQTDFGFKCPKCNAKGTIQNFCSKCGAVESVSAHTHPNSVIPTPVPVSTEADAKKTE